MSKNRMNKYQLTEKLSTEAPHPVLRVGDFITRFFFRDDDDTCYTLQSQIDYMIDNFINEMDLWLAERETNVPYFFCKHFGECGDKSESGCGKLCEGYNPRNGKSGVCKHYGYTYEKTDRCFTLKIARKKKFHLIRTTKRW